MRKTDKKIDNQIRAILTNICEDVLKEFDGFRWLSHIVNYSNFPKKFKVICVFETNDQLLSFTNSNHKNMLASLIQEKLAEIDIIFKNMTSHITYDTEEECLKSHNGNWTKRLG